MRSIRKVYLAPCQTWKIERFAKIVNSWSPLTIFAKRSILNPWLGCKPSFAYLTFPIIMAKMSGFTFNVVLNIYFFSNLLPSNSVHHEDFLILNSTFPTAFQPFIYSDCYFKSTLKVIFEKKWSKWPTTSEKLLRLFSVTFLMVLGIVFHPSEVGKMSTRNFWELSGKK